MSINSTGKTSGSKNGMYGKTGEQALNGKKIYQYEDAECTKIIKVFNSISCVLEYLRIKGHASLYKAIKNGTVYKEYYWRKEEKV